MNCLCAAMNNSLTLWHASTVQSPFSSQLIASNSSLVLIIFCQCFTWIALGDVDLRFSLSLLPKVNGVEEEIT